ncbi:class I SAM-dependent methyltransferase [Streptomyces spectabilis]|uniref:Class I SAM-dependent methyltransferase n=1 Tax=Streptomyces spectabilis TaxID=68270 RepID=A0A5P2X391_STRST|nr:class I SAM-dependent methyltransferase [Streptomyces spectabilis]
MPYVPFVSNRPVSYVRQQATDDPVERVLRARHSTRRHHATAHALARHLEPESWLDVGTGHGRLPAAAKDVLPYTAYDGTDTGDAVEEARDAGHIEEAHQGLLPDLADRLADRYDAVSMVHHLECVPDPEAELAAARTVLRPGGHLVIEAADPESRSARILGPWWPAHARAPRERLLPIGRLRRTLDELGFTLVDVERRAPHLPLDLTGAAVLAADRWLPRAAGPRRACGWATAPLIVLAYALDQLLAPLLTRTGFGNTYRVIARRDSDV